MGFFRSMKELFFAYRNFGQNEIQALRKDILEHQKVLLQIKELQRVQQEAIERQALNAVRESVARMVQVQECKTKLEKETQESLDSLQVQAEKQMNLEEKKKTAELISTIDIEKLLDMAEKEKPQENNRDDKTST